MDVYFISIILSIFFSATPLKLKVATENNRPNVLRSVACDKKHVTMERIIGWAVDCSNRNVYTVPDHFPQPTLSLNLSENNLKSVHAGDFNTLVFLFELVLSNNQISTIGNNTFKGLENLRILDLSGNSLSMNSTIYHPDVFKDLRNMTVLRLNNNIKFSNPTFKYPSSALSYAVQLNYLSIDGLENQTFGKEMSKLKHFTNLKMSGEDGFCSIKYISADFLMYMPYLEDVELIKCNIRDIHKDAFTLLHQIIAIDLSRNYYLGFDMTAIAFEGLVNSTSIRTLRINQIYPAQSVSVLVECSHFKSLKNTSLEHLEMDSNGIEKLAMPQTIRYLSVRDNRLISDIYVFQIFSMPNLQFIDASNQAAQGGTMRMHSYFGRNLRTILFNNNAVYTMTGPFPGLKYIRKLELKDNHCSHIDDDFFYYGASLEYLNLRNNELTFDLESDTDGNIFKNLHELKTLDLNRNRISVLPANVFRGLLKLQELDLCNNRLEDLTAVITHMDKLNTLKLENNMLTTLDSKVTQALDRKRKNMKINLLGNPLVCSCRTLDFLRWLQSTHIKVLDLPQYTCKCPFKNGTENICYLSNIDSITSYLNSHCISYVPYIIGGASFLVVVLLVITGLVVRHYKWRLTYLYYLSNAKYGGYQRLGEFKKDAFISYTDKDVDFVIKRLIPELEEQYGSRLCVRHREFLPGVAIAENITNWIHDCSHTVIVLSNNFIKNKWCNFEFNIARMDNIYANRDVIIIVIYEAVNEEKLPPEIKEFMILNKNSVFKYTEDESFWNDLRRSVRSQKGIVRCSTEKETLLPRTRTVTFDVFLLFIGVQRNLLIVRV